MAADEAKETLFSFSFVADVFSIVSFFVSGYAALAIRGVRREIVGKALLPNVISSLAGC